MTSENDFDERYFWYQFVAIAVKFLSCQRTFAIAAQQLKHFFIHENFSCKFQEHQNFQFRNYLFLNDDASQQLCLHFVAFIFATLRRFSSQHYVAFVFATMRRFRLRNIASLSSSQHCVAFVFATLRRFRLRNIASLLQKLRNISY